MITFVIAAAGRGSRLGRVGDELHKSLVPLAGQAILSRQFDLAPLGARFVIVTGYRADQLHDYVRLAHPGLDVTFVHDDRWSETPGPGASLLCAAPVVPLEDDLIWVACDTLWERDDALWESDESWLAVAPLPAGTPAARWCRAVPTVDGNFIERIDDKTPDVAPGSVASTALGYVVADDLTTFWQGLEDAETRAGEVQFSSGLDAIIKSGQPLGLRFINWLDVGDEQAYRAAQATFGVYDDVKPGQATYVLPKTGYVVKFHADPGKIRDRVTRATLLGGVAPLIVQPTASNMLAYAYVPGQSAYAAIDQGASYNVTDRLLAWWQRSFWNRQDDVIESYNWYDVTMRFYRDKTFTRVMALPRELQTVALDGVTRVDWDGLIEHAVPGIFHGDLTYANVIIDQRDELHAVDWREDFAGVLTCADLRYDLGKLLGATEFHWEKARHGDFRYWQHRDREAKKIRRFIGELGLRVSEIEIIAALTLINSAPLHAAPMDEILVARGTRWLERLT